MKTERLPMRNGKNGDRSQRKRRGHGHLQETKSGQRMPGAIALDENYLQRIAHRAAHHQQIASIEIGNSLARNREVVKTCKRSKSPSPCPTADSAPPNEP